MRLAVLSPSAQRLLMTNILYLNARRPLDGCFVYAEGITKNRDFYNSPVKLFTDNFSDKRDTLKGDWRGSEHQRLYSA